MTTTYTRSGALRDVANRLPSSRTVRPFPIALALCAAFALLVPLTPGYAQKTEPAQAKSRAAQPAIRLQKDPATGGIRLEAKGAPLREVLEKLASRAGFTLEGADTLTEGERVVVSKTGQPEVLLEALLSNYNYSIAFADDAPRVSVVIITGKRSLITTDAPPSGASTRPDRAPAARVEPALPVVRQEPAQAQDAARDSFATPAPTTNEFGTAPAGDVPLRTMDQILGSQIAPLQATDRNGLTDMVRQATTSPTPAATTSASPDLRNATQRAVQDLQKLLESLRAVEGQVK